MEPDIDRLQLRFFDLADPRREAVPALVLARSIDALQRLALLVGRCRDGRTPGQRLKPSLEEQRRYRLICDLPTPGSYVQPVRLEGASLIAPQETAAVLGRIATILEAAGGTDDASFETAVGDETWRRYMLYAVERLAPPAGAGVGLEVRRCGVLLCSGDALQAFVERASRRTQRSQGRAAVVGDLKKIDFLNRQITLRHDATARELVCGYEDGVEASLLEHPREPILVFGLVTRDQEGRPQSIDAVDHIEAVDLAEIVMSAIDMAGRSLRPKERIIAEVKFNEDDVLYEAMIEQLDIATFAETRDGSTAVI